MTRTWPALVASGVAVVVLLALVYASRPLEDQAFESHYQLLNAIAASAGSYELLLGELQTGRRDIARLSGAVPVLRERLDQGTQALALADRAPADGGAAYDRYAEALAAVMAGTERAAAELDTLQAALALLREDGPATVQQVRDTAGEADADRLYSLWLDVYEFGLGSPADADALRDRIANLVIDDDTSAPQLAATTAAMRRVLAASEGVGDTLATIEAAGLVPAAAGFSSQIRDAHADSVAARDRARLLLSLYSVLLFFALCFFVYRLYRSHRELNDAHAALKVMNEELEERVEARTEAVNKAYEDLQQSQVQLVQAEKMSSLGQLVAGISHEINTPLLYLQSNATLNMEALQRIEDFMDLCHRVLSPKRLPDESIESARARFLAHLQVLRNALVENEVREEVQEVIALTEDNLEGLDELTRLAQGLKDFSRLDRAPVERFDLNDCVKRTLLIVKNLLKRHVTVTTQFGELPPMYCAPSQINQVLLNLITNASQAIEGHGEITITTAVEGHYAVVSVRDTGCGISPDIMTRIRDPFFTTKEVGKGTGLGLSIVDEIVRKHDGRLEVASTPGEGSTFTVYLPLGRSASEAEQTLSDAAPAMPVAAAAVPERVHAEDDQTGSFVSYDTDSDDLPDAATIDDSPPEGEPAEVGAIGVVGVADTDTPGADDATQDDEVEAPGETEDAPAATRGGSDYFSTEAATVAPGAAEPDAVFEASARPGAQYSVALHDAGAPVEANGIEAAVDSGAQQPGALPIAAVTTAWNNDMLPSGHDEERVTDEDHSALPRAAAKH